MWGSVFRPLKVAGRFLEERLSARPGRDGAMVTGMDSALMAALAAAAGPVATDVLAWLVTGERPEREVTFEVSWPMQPLTF